VIVVSHCSCHILNDLKKMVQILNLKMHFFLLFLVLSSTFLNRGVEAQTGETCQTCMDFWSKLSLYDTSKKCSKSCKLQVREDDFEFSPVCDKKKNSCCRKLCKIKDAFKACKKTNHCSNADLSKPTSSPTAPNPFPEKWCPDYYPGSDTDCLLTGSYSGTCYYSSSHQEGDLPNTDSKACACNEEGNSKFSCESAPFPGGLPTSPPTVTPPETAPPVTAPPVTAPPITAPPISAPPVPVPATLSPTLPPPPENWCPEYFPGSGDTCLLSGSYRGTCYYSSSAKEGELANTDSHACSCNFDGTSTFSCESAPFPGGIPTAPPTVTPEPPPDNWCPEYFPGSDVDCLLTNPYYGNCYYSSSATEEEQSNTDSQACLCNGDGNSKFSCESAPFPGGIPTRPPVAPPDPPPDNWCPEYFPGSEADCLLIIPYVGTCYYSSSAQGGDQPNTDSQACRCNESGDSKFSCESAQFPGGIPTTPPVAPPDPPPDNWCPNYFPGTGTDCLLSSPYAGNCYYSSNAQEGEIPNSDSQRCLCNGSGNSKFVCVSTPFPGTDGRYLVENFFERRSLSDDHPVLDSEWISRKAFDDSPIPLLESSVLHI